jgi:purine nucleosidase
MLRAAFLLGLALVGSAAPAAAKRLVIIDQDGRGPGTSDQTSMLLLLQAPDVEVLGITIVSGDQWRDEEVAHTLRMLELTGHAGVKVYPGAIFPLINSREEIARWEKLYGRVYYQGAWNDPGKTGKYRVPYHDPYLVPALPEGNPALRPEAEDAAHFIIRMLHLHPHAVTVYAAGPLTDLAQVVSLDPGAPELAEQLVVMGGSIGPANPSWHTANRREFNFWWDPEAVHIALRAPWPRVTLTTVDISVQTRFTPALIDEIGRSPRPTAQYVARYADEEFLWDELAAAAWLDPRVVTASESLYLDIDTSHTAGYGNTLVWRPGDQPGLGERLVTVQTAVDLPRLDALLVSLLSH